MKYNFDEVVDRRHTNSIKWDNGPGLMASGLTDRFDGDTIPAFVADMDFRTAQPVIDAMVRTAEHGVYGYTSETTDPAYHQAVIDWFARRRGWEIRPEEILYVNGTVNALSKAVKAFSAPGEGVIIMRPVYAPFTRVVEQAGRKVLNCRLRNDHGYYTIDYALLEQLASAEDARMLIFCSPHNPVGRVWTRQELQQVAEICRKHQVLMVADEIHGDLVRVGQEFVPMAVAAGEDGLITCTAANKTFNLAGLQATNVIVKDPQLRERLRTEIGEVLPTPFGVNALIAAYNEGEEWLEQLRVYLDGTIDETLAFLKERMPQVVCRRPEGTYILWLDFRAYGLPQEELHERIYHRANVVWEPGTVFDPEEGEGFERVCIPARRALIREMFERVAREF